MSSLRDQRFDDVRRRLTDMEHNVARRHPGFADAVGTAFARLRGGLARAHAGSDTVSEPTWAAYVADLDRGLDELSLEIDRAAERQLSSADVEEVVATHTSALEQQGWRLHFAPIEDPRDPRTA